MKQIRHLRASVGGGFNNTLYWHPLAVIVKSSTNTTVARATAVMPAAGTFRNLVARLPTAVVQGTSTFTLHKNGVATGLSVSLTVGQSYSEDITDSVTVAVGDTIAFVRTASGFPGAAVLTLTYEWEPDVADTSIYGFGGQDDPVNSRTPLLDAGHDWDSSVADVEQLVGLTGAITSWRIRLSAAPGGITTRTFTIYKNGVAQDGTGGTVDTRLAFGAAAYGVGSVSLVATTPGQWHVGFLANRTFVNTSDRFHLPFGYNGNFVEGATETDEQFHTGSITSYQLGGMIVLAAVAPGAGKSITATLRKDLADTGQSVTLSDLNVTGATAGSAADLTGTADVALLFSPSGTPSSGDIKAAWFGFGNSPPVVNAGVDQTFTWPQNITNLLGSATDPEGGALTYLWTKVSGPGTVTFGDDTDPTTTATFSVEGVYVLRLTATDVEGAVGTDDVTITINSATAEIEFPPEDNVGGDTIGLSWRELYHVDAAGEPQTFLAAPVDLNDPAFYYGGYKQPRILSWGEYIRSLSDDRGNYESAEFSWVESDTDRLLRGWLGNAFQRYLQNRQVIVRMVDDASRRLFVTPRTVLRGIIRGYKPRGPLHFELRAQDFLTSLFGSANLQKQIPQEAISRAQFPTCPTDAIGKPVPILFGDLSNALSATAPPILTGTPARGFYDDGGGEFVAGFGDHTSLASIPTLPIVAAGAAASGTVGLDVDYWNGEAGAMVTAVDVNGVETDPVPFYSDGPNGGSRGSFANGFPLPTCTVDGTTKVTVSWTAAANAAKYRVYLGYYYFGFRPQLMKEVTAPTVTVDFTSDTDGTPGSFSQFWWYAVSAVMPDGETGISQTIFGIVRTHRRLVRIEWNAVTGATAYRIYRRGATGEWDRKWEVAAPTVIFDDDLLDTGATFITGLAELTGVIPVTYIGIEQDDEAFPWHAFLVCGHQVEAITAVYQNGVVVDPGNYGVTFLVPGQAGYGTYFAGHTGTPQYVTVNSRRYTKIYVRGPQGDAASDGTQPITINVKGRRNEAGTFLTAIADIYREFVLNFGFQDAAGAYLTNPTWPVDVNGDTLTQIDLASFDTIKAVHGGRLAGGYPGAIAFGADGAFITLRDAVAQLNVSADCESFFDRNSRFAVSIFDQDLAVETAAQRYTQLTDIVREKFALEPQVDEVENIIVYSYRRHYVVPSDGRRWDIEDAEDTDATSIANLQEERRSRPLELHGIRSAGPAIDIAERRLVRKSVPPVMVELQTNLYGLSTELGDVIRVTHLEGASLTGWTLRTLRVKRHITNPQNYTVRLICEDVDRLYDYWNQHALPAAMPFVMFNWNQNAMPAAMPFTIH